MKIVWSKMDFFEKFQFFLKMIVFYQILTKSSTSKTIGQFYLIFSDLYELISKFQKKNWDISRPNPR